MYYLGRIDPCNTCLNTNDPISDVRNWVNICKIEVFERTLTIKVSNFNKKTKLML